MNKSKEIFRLLTSESQRDFSRLLVVMTDQHIGNLLVALYVIKAAQQELSSTQTLCCVVDANLIGVARFLAPAVEFLPYSARDRSGGVLSNFASVAKLLCQLRSRGIDTAVDLYGHSESCWLARLSGAAFISAFYSKPKLRKRYDWTGGDYPVVHQMDAYYHSFIPLQLPAAVPPLQAPRSKQAEETLSGRLEALGVDLSGRVVVIHPGAGKAYKLWPVAHWQALIRLFEEERIQVLLIGAGSDKQQVEGILSDQTLKAVNGFQHFSLIETIRLGFLVDAMVGNDSGPTHLLATTPSKVFSLFGPTDVELWAPVSESAKVLRVERPCGEACTKQVCAERVSCLEELLPEVVFEAVMAELG